MSAEPVDVASIRMHLDEMKSAYERAMREGEIFVNLKKIYMEIREMECHLKALVQTCEHAVRSTGYTNNQGPFS